MLDKRTKINYIIKNKHLCITNKIFDENICQFLSDLSKNLLKLKESKLYPDLYAFLFLTILTFSLIFTVLILTTLTLNIFSILFFMDSLLAFFLTLKTTLLNSDKEVDFSVTLGEIILSR